jgi:N-acetylglucosamine PTS system EIICBA or EIICB component
MFQLFKKHNKLNLVAPITGQTERLTGGNGIRIHPLEGIILSPCDGQVKEINHIMKIETSEGIEIEIRVGHDTDHLNGEGFKLLVEPGQKINKRSRLLELDLEYLKDHASSLRTDVVIQNMDLVDSIRYASGSVKCGIEDIMVLKLK